MYTDPFVVFCSYVFVNVQNTCTPSTRTKNFKVRVHESQHLPALFRGSLSCKNAFYLCSRAIMCSYFSFFWFKLWMMMGQIHQEQNHIDSAREAYKQGVRNGIRKTLQFLHLWWTNFERTANWIPLFPHWVLTPGTRSEPVFLILFFDECFHFFLQTKKCPRSIPIWLLLARLEENAGMREI